MKKLLLLALVLMPFVVFAQTNAQAVINGGNFVTLTALPGLQNISAQPNFISLFNNLYKICIGAAAALALLQIIYAGATWMTAGDSSEKVSQARSRIQNAAFGLLLVLSPVIVFGIINPNILSLNLNVGGLSGGAGSGGTTATAGGTVGAQVNQNGPNGNGPEDGSQAAGQSCDDNAQACASGLVCSYKPDGTDTCVSAQNYTGQVACDDGNSVTAPATCQLCPDGSNASTLAKCPNTNGSGVPNDGSLGEGDDCEQNAGACGSGLICQNNPNGDDTCESPSSGQTVSCDWDTAGPGQSCQECPDGNGTASNLSDCQSDSSDNGDGS